MPRIGIILGSTRPNRNGEQVARTTELMGYVLQASQKR